MFNKLICFLTAHQYNGEKKIQDFDRLGITKFSWKCQRCGKEESHIHYNGINMSDYFPFPQDSEHGLFSQKRMDEMMAKENKMLEVKCIEVNATRELK